MINEIKKWIKKGMLYLKEANFEDVEKEYEFIVNTPADENGFTNSGFGCSLDEFIKNR